MSKLRVSVLALLDDIGERSGCHRTPERSFKYKGYIFPVCARCTGVFFGESAALVLLIPGLICPWYIAMGLLAVMGADWLVQRVGIRESTNIRRLITGICGGYGLFSVYIFIAISAYNIITGVARI